MARRQPYAYLNEPLNVDAPHDEMDQIDEGGIEITIDDNDSPIIKEEKSIQDEPRELDPLVSQPEPKRQEIQVQQQETSAEDEAYRRLKAQLDREQAHRLKIEQRLAEEERHRTSAEERYVRAESDRIQAEELAIDNALQAQIDAAERAEQYQVQCLETGDFKEAARAARAVVEAEQSIARLREGKNAIVAQKSQRATEITEVRQPETQRQQSEAERIEAYINQPNHSQRVRNYFHQHYDNIFMNGNPEVNTANLIFGHQKALSENIQPDTDAYFRFLDQHMGYDRPVRPQVQNQNGLQQQVYNQPLRERQPAAAPVSRDTTGSPGGRQVIRLTAAQKEMCDIWGLDYTEYWKADQEIQKERKRKGER